MKIVILDGRSLNPGDLDWSAFSNMGETTIHDRTPVDDQEEIIRQIGRAHV